MSYTTQAKNCQEVSPDAVFCFATVNVFVEHEQTNSE